MPEPLQGRKKTTPSVCGTSGIPTQITYPIFQHLVQTSQNVCVGRVASRDTEM